MKKPKIERTYGGGFICTDCTFKSWSESEVEGRCRSCQKLREKIAKAIEKHCHSITGKVCTYCADGADVARGIWLGV